MSQESTIARKLRADTDLTPLEATAAKLYLAYGGADEDGALKAKIDAFWASRRSKGGYDAYLRTRMDCDACGEVFKLENLSVCPNCFSTACYRHARACRCGFQRLG